MECPHCRTTIFEIWATNTFQRLSETWPLWYYSETICPKCSGFTLRIDSTGFGSWQTVYPIGFTRKSPDAAVPSEYVKEYKEAAAVLQISPKASAALSRRCLQSVLRDHGYQAKDLSVQIENVLAEQDPLKAIPSGLRQTIDGIRNFGNFSAHKITDKTTLEVIDVEPNEAEWCLDILDEVFDHYYLKPAQAAARKAALDQKLAAARKPPSK